MGQPASSINKYLLLLCGESSEDDEQNQYETPPLLFYPQIPSSPSFLSSTDDNNNYAPSFPSSSSGSNSFVDSTTSHISLPPYTPSDFYDDALFSGTSSSHGEEEFVHFPRFGSPSYEYSSALPPYTPLDFYNDASWSPSTYEYSSAFPPYTPPDFYDDAPFSGASSSHGEEEFVYFPRFGSPSYEYSSVINHYCSDQRILLVGEGDFSFSGSLARAFGSASNIIATSLDSAGFLQKNYEKAMSNIQSLKARGCTVLHGVDATQMANSVLKGMKFDCIIFNFPHAGFFPDESREAVLCRHRALVGGFLENAKKMITENGEIHITHKSYGFFREWKLEALALDRGLILVQELHFDLEDYPGYCTKYGFGGDKNFDCSQSKTYKFGLLY